MFIRQQMISFLTAFIMVFGFLVAMADAEAVDNPVVTNGKLGEFRHGTFPSLGERTHVGVDIVASCGSDIYAFADGRVKDVISNKNDKNFKALGYMILIEHPASLIGKAFYTLYLHMQDPPTVKIGDQVYGSKTIIGKVGDTGAAYGCNTHFEIRYFPERLSKWGNIYGSGDQRASEYFKQNWEDPIAFFEKYPTGITINKSANDPKNEDTSNTKIVMSKKIPVHIENLVFKKSKFSEPISETMPCVNVQDEVKEMKREGRCIIPIVYIGSCIKEIDYRGSHLRLYPWQIFLIESGHASVEKFNVKCSRTNREEEFEYFHYTDKIKPYILRSERASGGLEILLAWRKLKSIDYTNQYEGTLSGTRAKTQFYAITFSYVLEEKLPGLPYVDKVFRGKAKAYFDPDDGQWKLWYGGIKLEDHGSREYRNLIEEQYKEAR
ncbi:MAG: M23 family metallopeptidase [Nitrospirae bacterium]|nr:M23 family metallopeptidase [Nitrospirota bacterium]